MTTAKPETAPAAPACTIAIFSAAGNLTKRLLIPALNDLAVAGLLDGSTKITGINRADLGDESFQMERPIAHSVPDRRFANPTA